MKTYVKEKLILGVTALAVGLPASAFALLGWPQTAQSLFDMYNRYVCLLGSVGAIILGALLTRESLNATRQLAGKQSARPVENVGLDFLVMTEQENEASAQTET